MLLLPLMFRAWNPSEGLQWLPESSMFGAPKGASGAVPVPIHPCAGEAGLGRIPGPAPEGSSGCSHLHPAALGFLSQNRESGWSMIFAGRTFTPCAVFHLPLFFFFSYSFITKDNNQSLLYFIAYSYSLFVVGCIFYFLLFCVSCSK